MPKLKKRKKSSRKRGSGTHGRGSRKKARGKGHKGGKGMSGSGKRADQKKTTILNYDKAYFGSKAKKGKKKEDKINIGDLSKNIENFIDKGKEKEKGGIKINLPEYKILGDGEVDRKLIVKAKSFSKIAKKKIEDAGGKAIVSGDDEEESREDKGGGKGGEKGSEKKSEK